MKKKILFSATAAALIIFTTGCGSSSSSSSDTATDTTTDSTSIVKVVDGYVNNAIVCDIKNNCAVTDVNGTVESAFDLSGPLTVKTGTNTYIDVNGNNIYDSEDVILPSDYTMSAPTGVTVITPITDLIVNGADPDKLAAVLGVDKTTLYNDPIATNDVNLSKAIQIAYAVKVAGNLTDFINEINNFNFTTSTVDDTTTNDGVYIPTQESPVTAKTVYIPQQELPPTTTTTTQTDTNLVVEEDTNDTQNTESNITAEKGSVELFAQLALNTVTKTEAKTFIENVIQLNVQNAQEVEETLAAQKKELAPITVDVDNTVEDTTPITSTTTITEPNEENTTISDSNTTTEDNNLTTTDETTETTTDTSTTSDDSEVYVPQQQPAPSN